MVGLLELVKSQPVQNSIILVLATALLLVILKAFLGGRKGNVVLLLGAPGSGKTTLFYQLTDGDTHLGTVSSLQLNRDTWQLEDEKTSNKGSSKAVDLVDIPGHPRVRSKAAQFYSKTRDILFLVDAVEFMGQKAEVAEHLYEVLSDPMVQSRKIPVLIVCNKADMGMKAHTTEFIRKRLEKELEALRQTRATLGEAAEQNHRLPIKGESFTFAGLKGFAVTVVSCSAANKEVRDILRHLRRP